MAMELRISSLQKFLWKSGKMVLTADGGGPYLGYLQPYPGPQYTWMEVFKKEDDSYVQTDADGTGWGGTSYGYSRHAIGDGGGFLFNIADVDSDGDLDILAPQFFIQNSGGR